MSLIERAAAGFRELQASICDALEAADGAARFGRDEWTHAAGGGGLSRVIAEGDLFEKGGVNFSFVEGDLPADYAASLPGGGTHFRATGVSLVLHPRSPRVPTTHANFRCLEKGTACWFGGGADLTPYYLERDDAVHFHRTLAEACDAHAPIADYRRWKAWCDEYFFLPHRGETRGVGGIFFDYLGQAPGMKGAAPADLEAAFTAVRAIGDAFVPAYLPIAQRRRAEPFGERERTWQLQRRGRYVEFNLVHDRGTLFGLKSGGRIESILMSLPPLARWDYATVPAPGTPEADLVAHLRPTDWLARG